MEVTETVLTFASSGKRSLRTTLPMWVVEQAGLTQGDKLQWKLAGIRDGLPVLEAFPVKTESPKKAFKGKK